MLLTAAGEDATTIGRGWVRGARESRIAGTWLAVPPDIDTTIGARVALTIAVRRWRINAA